MRKIILFFTVFFCANLIAQTTHQVCISEAESAGACGTGTAVDGVFTPGNLTIDVGDQIQFTTYMVALTGYNGTHDIQFDGSPANNVTLNISTDVLNQVTTVTTPPFMTPGVYPMECLNSNHCLIADVMSGYSCTGYSVTVTGTAPPCDVEADFSASSTEICAGDSLVFINNSTNATSYSWEIDGTEFSTDEVGEYTFSNAGNYTIDLIASDGTCEDTSTMVISVNEMPDAFITIDPLVTTVNAPVDIQFNTTGVDASTTYSWNLCDGSMETHDQDFFHSWSSPGTYCVCLTLLNQTGCSNLICADDSVTVEPVNSIESSELAQLGKIYPNPNSGKFFVAFNDVNTAESISVLDSKGVEVLRMDKNQIVGKEEVEISIESNGVYFVILETEVSKAAFQIVVE